MIQPVLPILPLKPTAKKAGASKEGQAPALPEQHAVSAANSANVTRTATPSSINAAPVGEPAQAIKDGVQTAEMPADAVQPPRCK